MTNSLENKMPLPDNDLTTPAGAACFQLMCRLGLTVFATLAAIGLIRVVVWCCNY